MRRAILAFIACLTCLPLLAGCWTQPESTASTPDADAGASAAPQPTASGDPSQSVTKHGVTVTGAPGTEPTITLAEDFPPATELIVEDLVVGSGRTAEATDMVTLHYVGMGQQSREVFDSSWSSGAPAQFQLSRLIEGFRDGVVGMQPGGRRLLIIPGALAYKDAGSPPAIGPDETLVFVVDLIAAEPAS